MLRPIERFEGEDRIPLYKITIKKVGEHYEGRVDNYLITKNRNKTQLKKELDRRCKKQHLFIKNA